MKKILTLFIISSMLTLSLPITLSHENFSIINSSVNLEKKYHIVTITAEEIKSLDYYLDGHIGPIWLPKHYFAFKIYSGAFEIKIDGEIQEIELPVDIIFRGFIGIGPNLKKRELYHDYSLNLFGICRDVTIVPLEVYREFIYEQPLFNITDIEDFGQAAYGLTSADFNNDNFVDFAVSWATVPFGYSKISIYYNNGNLKFNREDIFTFNYSYIMDLDSGDYDKDGDIDILYTYSEFVDVDGWPINVNGFGKILLNDGGNNFDDETLAFWHGSGEPGEINNRINPQVNSADYDMDGDIDFIVGDNSGIVELYLNDGKGNFTSGGVIFDEGYASWGLSSGDFDNDGDIDVLVSWVRNYYTPSSYVNLIKNMLVESNGTTVFEKGLSKMLFKSSAFPSCIQLFDYNKDNSLDFIIGNLGAYLYLKEPLTEDTFDIYDLGWLPFNEEGYNDALEMGAMTSADFNNDGKEDIVLGGVQGVVRLCINEYGDLPPFNPSISSPLVRMVPGKEYNISFSTRDFNEDEVYYYVDWGDGSNSGWQGPYPSGKTIVLNHSWDDVHGYFIKAKAKDSYGFESEWNEHLVMIWAKGRSKNILTNTFYDKNVDLNWHTKFSKLICNYQSDILQN